MSTQPLAGSYRSINKTACVNKLQQFSYVLTFSDVVFSDAITALPNVGILYPDTQQGTITISLANGVNVNLEGVQGILLQWTSFAAKNFLVIDVGDGAPIVLASDGSNICSVYARLPIECYTSQNINVYLLTTEETVNDVVKLTVVNYPVDPIVQLSSQGTSGNTTVLQKALMHLASTTSTFPGNSTTLVPLDTIDVDTAGICSTVTNSITPTLSGYYLVSYKAASDGVSTNSFASVLWKNGTLYSAGTEVEQTARFTVSPLGWTGSILVYMNGTTDYLQLAVTTTSVSTNTLQGSADPDQNFLSVVGPF